LREAVLGGGLMTDLTFDRINSKPRKLPEKRSAYPPTGALYLPDLPSKSRAVSL
jgi:hypothetical protein